MSGRVPNPAPAPLMKYEPQLAQPPGRRRRLPLPPGPGLSPAAALTLVGNRYGLDHTARQLLHRGVFAPEVAAPAGPNCGCSGMCRAAPWPWTATTSSSPWSAPAEVCPWWRRTTALSGTWARFPAPLRCRPPPTGSWRWLADYLADHAAGPLDVFYDAPLSLSGELARRTREVFASRGL